ncbi:MAG: DUF3394 domain-containing protein [Gammaproteobacteria bacterium]|nr:DUF3394 domain-containing protein [Gammaproteobacteria bacterium]
MCLTVFSATGAMLVFAAATQGYFLARSRWWESLALLLVAFTLFRPGYWIDLNWPPLVQVPPADVVELAARGADAGAERMLLAIEGEALSGDRVTKTIEVPLTGTGTGDDRLQSVGLVLREDEGRVMVDDVIWGSPAYEANIEFDWEIKSVQLPQRQPSKYWMLAPALGLLLLIAFMQRLRSAR